MNTLLSYASKNNKMPFYAFYSIPDNNTTVMCQNNDPHDCGVFVADAHVIEEFADGKHGAVISKNNLLANSNPFHCFFCCPLMQSDEYFGGYFPKLEVQSRSTEEIPQYVQFIIETHPKEIDSRKFKNLIKENKLNIFKHIAVYDLREVEFKF